ncbi:hypothetical protein V2I01_10005 [Micromonospora sp. BRA006-A]|nr:hypothetical protein [Micromonospora sp. BRA006-A]
MKALNTLTADLMTHPLQLADGDHSVFVSGDDAEAKKVVVDLLTSFGHSDVIDLGDITTARAPRCCCRSGCASTAGWALPCSTSRSCAENA